MAIVTGLTKERMLEIEAASVVSGSIDGLGHLILETHGGDEIDAGYALVAVPDASTTVKGVVELATSAETEAASSSTRAVTPASLAVVFSNYDASFTSLNSGIAGHETRLDAHDTDISGLESRLDDLEAVPPYAIGFPGEIRMWAGGSPPTGWQICYGQALSRTTYSELFAVIGTDYGSGDGSTTFNAPNFEGRVPVGVDFTQGEFEPMGKTGGSKTHQLTTAEMPAHVHSNRAVNWNVTPAGSGTYAAFNSAVAQNSEDTGSTGGGGHHNNLQPYLTVRFIIKT